MGSVAIPYFSVVGPALQEISTSTTWGEGVHVVKGQLTIDSGATLTLGPGAILKFDTSTTSGIVVNGTLNASSSPGNLAIFLTSLKDDLVGGDTNGDGNATAGNPGDWSGITVNSGGTANFGYSVIRYGDSAGGSNAMIYNNGGTLTIGSRSTVTYADNYGIKNSSGTATITESDISYNNYGVYVAGGSVSINATSTIHNNTTYGVYNNTVSSVSATGNYWGDSSGPTHSSNPSGTGDAVSDYVSFSPFIGTSTLHYIESSYSCPSSNCASVQSQQLLLDASTTIFTAELGAASSTWNSLQKVLIATATSTAANLTVTDISAADGGDLPYKGTWFTPNDTPPNLIKLNRYYLDNQSFSEIQNTITHELGHAIGLGHSYPGNIMFLSQSSQTNLGPQDTSDYNYLWP